MKISKNLLFILIIPLIFAGCLQVETRLKVNKDGSGTINEKVLFSKTFVNMLKEFAQAFQDSTSTEEFNIYNEKDLEADAKNYGDNVVFDSFEKINIDNWEGYQAVYKFNDVTKIKISPDPDSKVNLGEETTTTEEKEFYFFKFVKGESSQLIIDRPDIELNSDEDMESDTEEVEEGNEEEDEEFLKMMEGMKIDIYIEFEGNIVNTNASYVEGSRITLFEMNFAEMMKNKEVFEEFKRSEPKNIYEMKQYLDKLPGIKIEIEKPITVNFK